MSKLVHFVGFLLVLAWAQSREISPKYGIKSDSPIHINVDSESGERYNLKLSKPDKSVLHPNIKVITVGTDAETGLDTYDYWTPSKKELTAAEDVYIDEKNLAAVRVNNDRRERSIVGVVNGKRLETKNGEIKLYESVSQNHSDYIDLGRKLTHSTLLQSSLNSAANDAVAEILVVCDKEFGDVFQHDRVKILDYLTIYFWDVNLRYKTLPSINLTFRVTGVLVISTPSGQPFIEDARAPDGRAEFGRIKNLFSYWLYQQMSVVPKFDMAVAITNTKLEWGGGLATRASACWVDNTLKRHVGTLVFNDGGDWGSLTVGTHEMAHTLGAPHDDDPNYPGGCADRGYIMSGGNDDLRWFFSTCSDRTISNFVTSNQASCLRTIDEGGNPPISPDFSFLLAPSKAEQCKRKLNNPNAYVNEADIADCKVMKCRIPGDSRIYSFPPIDNTPCGIQSRCFRGRCRMPGSLIRNVGDGRCLQATDPFAFTAPLELVNCPRPGTPLDRFVIFDYGIGNTLSTPWGTRDAKETGDKCVYTGNVEGGRMLTDVCSTQDPRNPWHVWDFIDVGNGEFMLSHRVTRRCAKPDGVLIRTYANCDRNDPNMRWKLE